ncbi:sulfate transporter family-domain-containing protein [Aspergillus pseudoustus]|uniref:Sulfate transporter family-domain-containing protein n=1 Tax=Aspergillus pseudoustus TaxID=1810923 RepID=A0ABR4KSM0_9EURO
MADSRPFEAEQSRSLRDRVFDIFRASSSPSSVPRSETHTDIMSRAEPAGSGPHEVNTRTPLLRSYDRREPPCGLGDSCDHGTFTPRVTADEHHGWRTTSTPELGGERSRMMGNASRHSTSATPSVQGPENIPVAGGSAPLPVKHSKSMYISYYIPFFNWITQYRLSYLRGDFSAALTVASIYIPMGLSLSNIAHAPPTNGLYSFVFQPFIYAILGSAPLLVLGPEAAGSLLTGTIVKASVNQGNSGEEDEAANAIVVGVATALAGAMILVAGIFRLGFLDNVLSRPFLRGFITAIGFVIFVDQFIPELGLAAEAKDAGVTHGSTIDKLVFIFQNIGHSHGLTAAVAFTAFAIIMVFRTLKKHIQPRYPQVIYFPDRILVVILSAILTEKFGWHHKGLEILGPTKDSGNGVFDFEWPFQIKHMKHMRTALSTSFIIALLGFFESSVAAKGLTGVANQGVQGIQVSPNREMVALGFANVVGGCFMSLPAFGGYARSKVNASTGARSPMSNIILSLITLICITVLLPYLYYLPKAVLSSMISVVAYSLIEECPHDLSFFVRIRGWSELALMMLIFVSTIFYSLELGIALGMGLSVLILIRHSTKPRIQILGKVEGSDRFDNAELQAEHVELVEGALIVKIPEPLTFANTGDLKNRLRRLEMYGTSRAHPSMPRIRPAEHNQNVIFDVHGVTSIDGSGTQVLYEIVDNYAQIGARVYFCRVPNRDVYRMFERSGIIERCGGISHVARHVDEALKLVETESRTQSVLSA